MDSAHILTFRYGFIPMELFDVRRPFVKELKTTTVKKLIVHNPDCANQLVMKPIPWSEKNIKSLAIGFIFDLYPLRKKILKGIEAGVIDAYHPNHPGYKIETNHQNIPPPSTYARNNTELQGSIRTQTKYWKLISRAKICIFDSSQVRKSIRKFMEALMVGCVVASDLPFEMEELYRDVVIQIDESMTAAEIGKTLKLALGNEDELQRKAAKGILLAKKYFSCEHKVERMLDTYDEYQKGVRGYTLPFGVRLGCHSFMPPLTRPNPWCA